MKRWEPSGRSCFCFIGFTVVFTNCYLKWNDFDYTRARKKLKKISIACLALSKGFFCNSSFRPLLHNCFFCFIAANSDLVLRKTELAEKRINVQRESKMLLEYTRKAIAKLTELKRKEEMRNIAGQVMADLERNKLASAGIVPGGLSPLNETYTMLKFASFENIVELIYKKAIPVPKEECIKPLQLGISFVGGYITGIFCALIFHPANNLVSSLNNSKGATVSDQLENILGPCTAIVLKRMGELKAELFTKSTPPERMLTGGLQLPVSDNPQPNEPRSREKGSTVPDTCSTVVSDSQPTLSIISEGREGRRK